MEAVAPGLRGEWFGAGVGQVGWNGGRVVRAKSLRSEEVLVGMDGVEDAWEEGD